MLAGHSLHNVALSSGTSNLRTNALFILQMTDAKVDEQDPVTDFYPFMNAASAGSPDLSTVLYLLVRPNESFGIR